ncbi:MAG: hypothetical protein OXI96_06030 [Acidimicrobiaceae bacterium]|nr:hypothetical protein [Acidimicrobiaceae bacterium]
MDSELWAELTLKTLKASRRQTVSHSVPTENDKTSEPIKRQSYYWVVGSVVKRVAASSPSRTGLEIIDMLIRDRHDAWHARRVAEQAVDILHSAQDLAGTDEYKRLHNALLERGVIES